ncbi:MAG: hypothetical protein KJP04_02885 [Arenicella sp.]|nr:hypothetical protein [Arenicella sp.]
MVEYTPNNIYLFALLFVAVWVFAIKLLAHAGGWSKLAQDYPGSGKFRGETWSFQSIKLGSVNYNGCVTIGIDDTNLYLATFLPFRFGHKPLLIPIYDILGKEVGSGFSKYVQLTISNDHATTIRVSKGLADRLEHAAQGMWKYQQGQN